MPQVISFASRIVDSITNPSPGDSDLTHGIVEGQAEDLDMEVNGVAGQIALRPAPVAVLDDETGIGRQNKIACLPCDELESALLIRRSRMAVS